MTPEVLIRAWRARADELEPYCPPAAVAWRAAADDLERAWREAADEALTLSEAAAESGYSASRLRHMVADGAIPNAGRKGAPRLRRADLPRKQKKERHSGFDARAAARRLIGES
jgi:hypothetical protein